MVNWLGHADRLLTTWVVGHRVRALDPLMWGVSLIGRDGLVWYTSAVALRLARRLRLRAVARVFLAVLIAAFLSDWVLKPLIGRPRPFASSPAVHVIGSRPSDASFPSGHAANAFAGALTLAGVFQSGRWIWWPLAVMIAYSRVYLGVHYVSDVLGGALVGCISAVLVRRFVGTHPRLDSSSFSS